MSKSFAIYYFYWKFNQVDCFTSKWRQKCPTLRKYFACRPEIDPKHFDKIEPEPDREIPARLAILTWKPLLSLHLAKMPVVIISRGCFFLYTHCADGIAMDGSSPEAAERRPATRGSKQAIAPPRIFQKHV